MPKTNLGKVAVNYRGRYDKAAVYTRLDAVQYGGSTWMALREVTGIAPADGEDWCVLAVRGASGALPVTDTAYAPEITLAAMTVTRIAPLTGAVSLFLGEAGPEYDGYETEWVAVIEQGEAAQDVVLPEVAWEQEVAPSFLAGSVTEVRMWYAGDVLKGVWA